LNGSGPEHWQTIWEKKYGCERVQQQDWENPDAAEWIQGLNESIAARSEGTIIVAHSLGCLLVAQWAETHHKEEDRVKSALLVAPPDVEAHSELPEFMKWAAPHKELPFPSILVGSKNDPYATLAASRHLAELWGSRFVNAGHVGHINVDSGHGPWPDGESIFQELISP
jgi:uncharacterized protein